MFKTTFSQLQKMGQSLMLPVAILPLAGLLLGIGSAHFSGLSPLVSHLMVQSGRVIFDNLPLLFAVGITLGFTNNDGVAGLAAMLMQLIMLKSIMLLTAARMGLDPFASDYNTTLAQLPTPGVLGGMLVGLVTAWLFNRYHRIQLPDYLGFFSGKRFVLLVSGMLGILLGAVLAVIWPPINQQIAKFSNWAAYQNPALAFGLYGLVDRLLLPLGLHHIWNAAFFFETGSYITPAGEVFRGEIARYLAGDPSAGNLAGGYLFKMYGLPAAAMAIWHAAKATQRKKVKAMMVSAALTAFLTGITEPIEFTFLFIAPALYLVHACLAATGYVIAIVLGMKHSLTFSHSLFDFVLLLPLSNKSGLFPIVGSCYAVLYYAIFRLSIERFDLQTPGRAELGAVEQLSKENLARQLVAALGGKHNISDLNACITCLRIKVVDVAQVDGAQLKRLGATEVLILGSGVQAVFGTQSDHLLTLITHYLDND